jgi:hypothetical protein
MMVTGKRVQTGRRSARVTTVLAAGALGTLALAACSSGAKNGTGATGNTKTASESPAQAVTAALHELGNQSSLSVTLSLPITAAQAQQLGGKRGSSSLTPSELQALTSGSIFFDVATGGGEPLNSKQAQTDGKNSIDLGLTVKGNTPVEIKYVDQNLYARLQVSQLLTDIGENPSAGHGFTSVLALAGQYIPGLSALGQGNWVEVSHQSLVALEPALKHLMQPAQSSGSNTSASTLNPQQTRSAVLKLVGDLESALKTNTTFTNGSNVSGRTEYTATVDVSAVANAAIPILERDLQAIPQIGSSISGKLGQAQSKIKPGMTASADLYVRSGKLSEVDVDVAQFATKDKPSFQVPLRLAFGNPGSISAPTGATQLDTSKLPLVLGGLLGGSSST